MDRRTLLKSAGIMLGGLAAGGTIFNARAKSENILKIPTAESPLLLNFNENALGMSEMAKTAIVEALPSAMRYPDVARERLITQIAQLHGVAEQQISLGNGSSESIQAVVQMVANRGREQKKPVQLVVPDPTFNYAELYAKPLGVTISKVPLLPGSMAFDLDSMQQKAQRFSGLSLIYLCNPNNPTATITPADDLDKWIKQAPETTWFLLDEAYAEFVTDPRFRSGIALIKEGHKNVIVARTFSKVYALAGLRIGYAVAHPDTCALIEAFMTIDNTNLAGAVAASASLKDDAFLRRSLHSVEASRQLVTRALDSLELEYLPSQANFIFHRVEGDVKTYQDNMKKHHIYVGREFPPAVGWSRLTLGTYDEMAVFVYMLERMRGEGQV